MNDGKFYFDTDRVAYKMLLDPATMTWVDVAGKPELEAEVKERCAAATAVDPDWWRAKDVTNVVEMIEEAG